MIATLLGWLGGGRGVVVAVCALALGAGAAWLAGDVLRLAPLRDQLARAEAARLEAVKEAATRAAELAQLRAEVEARNAEIERQRAAGLARAAAAERAAAAARQARPAAPVPADVDSLNRAWGGG